MNRQQQQQIGSSSGLTRYRSAPSSYFATVLNNSSNSSSHGGGPETGNLEQFFTPPDQTQRISSRFTNHSEDIYQQSQFLPPRKRKEPDDHFTQSQQLLQRELSSDYSSASNLVYQNHGSAAEDANCAAVDNSYNRSFRPARSSNRVAQIKMEGNGGSGNSNLIRQNSSPAGLFSSINIDNEIAAMRGVGNFETSSNSNAEASFFSSMHPSETSENHVGDLNPEDAQFGDDERRDYSQYVQERFRVTAWDDSDIMPENFLDDSSKGCAFTDVDASDDQVLVLPRGILLHFWHMMMSCDEQSPFGGHGATRLLSHHLSLPKSCAQLSGIEKVSQDSVPCRIRAKRGCATHPRSIAERVRRTKISERMRKLQELVPNMEKQTNTSDMLDLAVEYIKDLQTRVKMLSDSRSKCVCFAK